MKQNRMSAFPTFALLMSILCLTIVATSTTINKPATAKETIEDAIEERAAEKERQHKETMKKWVEQVSARHPERKDLSLEDARAIGMKAGIENGLDMNKKVDYKAIEKCRENPNHAVVYWYDVSKAILYTEAQGFIVLLSPEEALEMWQREEDFELEYMYLMQGVEFQEESVVPPKAIPPKPTPATSSDDDIAMPVPGESIVIPEPTAPRPVMQF